MDLPPERGDRLAGLLAEISDRPGCRLLPPAGPAVVPAGLVVPEGLRRLYARCGGLVLFSGAPFGWRVSGPGQLVPASPRLLTPELADQIAEEEPTDLTNGCHVIADGGTGDGTEPHVVVDLHPDRAGRCYSAFWDSYGLVGEMPILAYDIVELLERLLATEGLHNVEPVPGHGDAYDQFEPRPTSP